LRAATLDRRDERTVRFEGVGTKTEREDSGCDRKMRSGNSGQAEETRKTEGRRVGREGEEDANMRRERSNGSDKKR
jgi:hypothetical protein